MGSTLSSKLFKEIDVWRSQSEDCMVRYRCYELLGEAKFCVQSADYFYLPITSEKILELEKQHVELFVENSPDERSGLYASLEDAIEAHDSEFTS